MNMTNKLFRRIAATAVAPAYPYAYALAAIVVASAVAVTGCSSKVDNSAEPSVETANNVTLTSAQQQNVHLYTVELSKFRKTIDTTGVVDFDNDQATSVLAPFSGPVSRLLVSLGDQVKKGDPLALVDSPDFASAVGAYGKAFATARTDRRLADLDKDLIEHHGVAQREADQAETDAVNAEADREAALQALISLQADPQTIKDIQNGKPLSHPGAMIRSPIVGTVVEKLITPGELLQAGSTPCFTVADLSRVWVTAQVFGSDLAAISRGDSAEVVSGVTPNNFTGTVDNISALMDPDTRSVGVRVVVENPGDVLKKQMYVRVLIQSGEEGSGLLVPVSAILRDDEKLPFVYIALPHNSYARQHVTLGYRAADQYEIVAGLQTGNEIVVEGGIFVQFMQNQ
jgi:cobalt-zinc-cadmium efflux system membrane fusion protein